MINFTPGISAKWSHDKVIQSKKIKLNVIYEELIFKKTLKSHCDTKNLTLFKNSEYRSTCNYMLGTR